MELPVASRTPGVVGRCWAQVSGWGGQLDAVLRACEHKFYWLRGGWPGLVHAAYAGCAALARWAG
eukprot:9794968-Alexandrium_andersonii.AAC.1